MDKDLVTIVKKRTPPNVFLDYAPDRVSPTVKEGVKDVVKTLNNFINVMRAFPHPVALALKARQRVPNH